MPNQTVDLSIPLTAEARATRMVYKYALANGTAQTIEMPTGAHILCVQIQHGVVCLWALVNPNNEPEPRVIRIVGTGHEFTGPVQYIGTVQQVGGVFVWHVFEVIQ